MIHRSWRIPLALVGVVVAAGLLYLAVGVGLMIGVPTVDDYRHRQRFDAPAWRLDQGQDRKWPTRLAMATDLVKSRILMGKTKGEILELLGPETETANWKDWGIVYWLGPERGFMGIDSEWLVVRYGSDGRAREVRIVTN